LTVKAKKKSIMRKNVEKVFMAVDIGCIECDEESAVIGVFITRKQADEACKKHEDWQNKHWHGEHFFEVFEVEPGVCLELPKERQRDF